MTISEHIANMEAIPGKRKMVIEILHLTTGIRVSKHVGLGKVAVWRQDNNIEHHWNTSKELLKVGRIRSLKKVEKQVDCVKYTFCCVTPTLLQAKLLKPNADHNAHVNLFSILPEQNDKGILFSNYLWLNSE